MLLQLLAYSKSEREAPKRGAFHSWFVANIIFYIYIYIEDCFPGLRRTSTSAWRNPYYTERRGYPRWENASFKTVSLYRCDFLFPLFMALAAGSLFS